MQAEDVGMFLYACIKFVTPIDIMDPLLKENTFLCIISNKTLTEQNIYVNNA